MNDSKTLEQMIIESKPVKCAKCSGKMFYVNSGLYRCEKCEYEVLDDFGKVKKFLEENGPTPALIISQATGVSIDVINVFLRQGRVEIPEGSKYYINCEKCGCSIRYGRFCPTCIREMAGGMHILFQDMGERPKRESDMQGKMHYLKKK